MRSTAGSSNVRIGRFSRFQHNKVLIQRSNGKPVKVLTGSANFSLRGLYAQANNVMVLANDQVARLFADAFDAAFNDPKTSRGSKSFATSDPARGGLTSAE